MSPGVSPASRPLRESLSHENPGRKSLTLARASYAVTAGDASHARSRSAVGLIDVSGARADFERAEYPKPAGMDPRRPAEQEFLLLVLCDGVDAKLILAAVALFAEQLRRDRIEPRFVSTTARGLRERRFEDIVWAGAPPAFGPRQSLSISGWGPWWRGFRERSEPATRRRGSRGSAPATTPRSPPDGPGTHGPPPGPGCRGTGQNAG